MFAKPRLPPATAARIFGTNVDRPAGAGGADLRPRDPGPLSDRLDLQADHRDRRRSTRATSASARSSTTPASSRSATADVPERRRRRQRRRSTSSTALQGLLRRLLLHARPAHERRRQATAGRSRTGRGSSGSASRPGSTSAARAPGKLPTPEERNQAYEQNTAKDSPCGEEVCLDKGEVTDRPWSVGDNVNLAVGQGDLQADPLQMAVAYAAIANGGDIVRPHVGLRVDGPAGPRDPGDRPGGPRPRRHRPVLAAGDPRRPPRRGDGAGRHLLPGVRRLPGRDRRQDRYRRAPGPGRPVLVHRPGALPRTRSTWSR